MLDPAFWFSCVQPCHGEDNFLRELDWMIFPVCYLKSLSSVFFRTQAGIKTIFMTYAVYDDVTDSRSLWHTE